MGLRTIYYFILSLFGVVLLTDVAHSQEDGSRVFWVDEETQEVGYIDLSTNERTNIIKGPGNISRVYDIAVDSITSEIYFITTSELKKGDPSKNTAETLYEFEQSSTAFTELNMDTETNSLFLTNYEQRVIYKFDLSSNEMTTIVTEEDIEGTPWGVASHNNEVYWMASGVLHKADQDGNNITVLSEDVGNPLEIEIDHKHEKLYWRDQVNDVIGRINLDGTEEEIVVTTEDYPPLAFTLNQSDHSLYWLKLEGVLVQTALDGSNPSDTTDIDERGFSSEITDLNYNPGNDSFYWVYNNRSIEFRSLSDTTYTLAFQELQPTSIGYDEGEGKLFWTDASEGLMMYDFNAQQESSLSKIGSLNNLSQFALDTVSNEIYVATSGILKLDYQGNILDSLNVQQAGFFSGITVDPENELIYFTDNASSTFGNLKKVNYDGTGLETIIEFELNYSRGLEFDPMNNDLYWASGFNSDSMRIKRMELDSETVETLLNTQDHGLSSPLGIALDPQNEHIYFSDSGTDLIQRADYNGENLTTIAEGGFSTTRDIEVNVNGIITSTEQLSSLPTKVSLQQNYPNPFNPTTNISFQLNKSQSISLTVYDMLGEKVKPLIKDQSFSVGNHTIRFNAGSLSSGVYLYRLETSKSTLTKKLTHKITFYEP